MYTLEYGNRTIFRCVTTQLGLVELPAPAIIHYCLCTVILDGKGGGLFFTAYVVYILTKLSPEVTQRAGYVAIHSNCLLLVVGERGRNVRHSRALFTTGFLKHALSLKDCWRIRER